MTDGASLPSAEAPTPGVVAAPAKPRRSLLEWFSRRRALAEAQQAVPELEAKQRERLLRGRAALELADRTLHPVDELRAGRGTPLACVLYREAIYWGLLAQDVAAEAPDLDGAFASVPRPVLLGVAGDEALLAEVQAALRKPSAETWLVSETEQQAEALKLQRFAKALLRHLSEPELKVARLLVQRTLRGSLLFGALALALVAGMLSLRGPAGPDLAAGRPWKTSSTFAVCNPKERSCAGAPSPIFFHTQEEEKPWLEIDLGGKREFSRVEIQNRSDCCEERAVPLVIEVSSDGKKWREVARRTELFSLWNAQFTEVKARYVRARVMARTFFHLERVSVYAR